MQLTNLQKYKKRKYSLVNQIFSAETATLYPVVFRLTPTLDTPKLPNGQPEQQFSYLVFKVCYFNNKMKSFIGLV